MSMTRINKGDFAAVGVPIESSVDLELDFHEQQYLAQNIAATTRELSYIPDLHPHLHQLELGRIAARNIDGLAGPTNLLSLAYTTTEDQLRNATIRLQSDNQLESTIQLSPNANIWEMWYPHQKEPAEFLENHAIVSMLSRRLDNPEAIDPLMDKVRMSPFEIATALGSYLKHEAKRRREQHVYSANFNEGQTRSFLDSNNANGRKTETLSVMAAYKIGQSVIRKTYDYRVQFNRLGPVSGAGVIRVGSSDGIAPNQLASYARADQEDNYPGETLHAGLSAIRRKYDLYDANERVA